MDKKPFKDDDLPKNMNLMDELYQKYGDEIDDSGPQERDDEEEELDLENDAEMQKLIQQANELAERRMREKREQKKKNKN